MANKFWRRNVSIILDTLVEKLVLIQRKVAGLAFLLKLLLFCDILPGITLLLVLQAKVGLFLLVTLLHLLDKLFEILWLHFFLDL